MRIEISTQRLQSDFVKKVEEISGQSLLSCNQCGKCSAGCPMSFAMDFLPNQVIRLVQLGLEEDIVRSKTVWICAFCFTCTVRCPQGVDLAKVMEAVRLVTLRRNIDYLQASDIPTDTLSELPQIALVGGFRKHTA
jgi:heterodisulfide reductase subunit C